MRNVWICLDGLLPNSAKFTCWRRKPAIGTHEQKHHDNFKSFVFYSKRFTGRRLMYCTFTCSFDHSMPKSFLTHRCCLRCVSSFHVQPSSSALQTFTGSFDGYVGSSCTCTGFSPTYLYSETIWGSINAYPEVGTYMENKVAQYKQCWQLVVFPGKWITLKYRYHLRNDPLEF